MGPCKPVIAVIFDIDFAIFTATLDGSHEHPAKRASLEAMQLMVSDIYSLCPAAMSVPELSVCIVSLSICAHVYVGNGCLSYYQGNPEIGDSIRAGHVIQGWDSDCVLTTVASN